MPERLPDFVIIGAPRSGTTTLFSYLTAHPTVFMPTMKEIRYFTKNWARGSDWYSAHFADALPGQRAGEASPRYMQDERAMARLDQTLPSADLVAVLRAPVPRAASHYHYRVARGLEDRSLEQAVHDETAGIPGAFPYLDLGRYHRQLTFAERLPGRHRLLVLWFDDLAGNPSSVLDALGGFLGLGQPWPDPPDGRVVNPTDRFRSLTLRRWARNGPASIRTLIGHVNRSTATYPPPPDPIRDEMIQFLRDDILALGAATGRDLGRWLA